MVLLGERTSAISQLADAARLAVIARTGLSSASDHAFDRYARMVRRQLGVPVALVSLVDDQRQFFPGQEGLPGSLSAQRETPLTHSFCQHVVTTEAPLVIEDARLEPLVAGSPAIPDLGVISYAGMPLTDASGTVLGSLCAISDAPRAWTEDDLDALADLAEACSSELRLRLGATASKIALSRLSMLSEVTRSVGTTLDADEALARLTRILVPTLGDWSIAGLMDASDKIQSTRTRHHDPAIAEQLEALARERMRGGTLSPAVQSVLRTGEAATVKGSELTLPEGLDAPSVLIVPLRARSGPLGFLALGRVAPYGEAEIHDAVDIGRRAGLSLDNAALFRHQRDSVESLQRDMLTRLPEPDHLHIVARYVPAIESAQIGGDWYDAFMQPDGGTVLVVGDVMGHDIAAAAMMGQLRNLVRGIAFDRDEAPAALLTRIDRSLRGLEVETLATVVMGRIEQTAAEGDRGLRRLRWSNAGHPPPVYLTAEGVVTVLDSPGELLLGIDPGAERSDHEHLLEPGSTVLLFTDGLVERRDSPLEDGLIRVKQALQGLAGEPLDVLCDTLVQRMLPDGSEDDVALIAVRCYDEQAPRPILAGPVIVPPELPEL